MTDVYVVQNQDGYYLDKHRQWVDGRDAKQVSHSQYRDEAINLVFEMSAKDIDLRATLLSVPLNEKGLPELEIIAPPTTTEMFSFDDASADEVTEQTEEDNAVDYGAAPQQVAEDKYAQQTNDA